MKFYNTLGRKVQDFQPIKDGEVKLYSCGPTVYDNQTIGNLRTYVFYDTLKRTLMAGGYKVKHVMNITDVGHLTSDADEGEDKLEKGAKNSGKTVWQVADDHIAAFNKDLRLLNIIQPEIHRATDFIAQQLDMIMVLLDKGFAYQTKQAIYFDVSKLDDYGKLTGQKLSDKEVAVRSEVISDKDKHSPQDFALWFFTIGRFKGHEMHWSSPWGDGFPGWHLECSAIVHATLSDPIDIHAGAVDLIGTHHTNEIAQTQAAFGHPLANYWLHSEHLLVNGQRMAKSLKNFYTLDDVIKRGHGALELRLLYLQSHYRSQMNFTWDSLSAAKSFLHRLQAWADLQFQPSLGHKKNSGENYQTALEQIKAKLDDDLDTPEALAIVSGLSSLAEAEGVKTDKLKNLLTELDKLFGLNLTGREDITDDQKQLITEREQARLSDSWQEADKLRAQLKSGGIEINDTPHGPVWNRATY